MAFSSQGRHALTVAALTCFVLLGPRLTLAQAPPQAASDTTTAERCTGDVYRQFDFWQGEWDVRSPEGELLGHNTITRAAAGCALLESWRGQQGGRGVSVNAYDADRNRWTQRWVGTASILWLEGGWEAGRMLLRSTATRETPRGAVLDRISWEPLPDGRVRQVWEVSTDGGETWEEIFVGLYSRTVEQVDASPA